MHAVQNIVLIALLIFTCQETKAQNAGCQLIENHEWHTRINVRIWDFDRGDIFQTPISSNVAEITSLTNDESLNNNAPYFSGNLNLAENILYLSTTTEFIQYEEYETLLSSDLTLSFRCTNGLSGLQLFNVYVQDTNNNSPQFLPSAQYDFTIVTPLLPGYIIGSCDSNIVVRDIDLTTSRIDFVLTGSDYFEIVYDEVSSTEPKEFKAILRTTTFIRTLPDQIELSLSATDVDATGDPPLTSYATVLIHADNELSLPEELVFTRAIYTATYTENNEVILDQHISLQQGYNSEVEFSIDEDYNAHFDLIRYGNDISLEVLLPLTNEILLQSQIYLIVRAYREFTTGATTTVVIQLPEVITIQFERSYYEGTIIDEDLLISDLILTQGYEDHTVSVEVSNEYFNATIQENRITITKSQLPESVIEENSFLNLEVKASTEHSSAIAIVTLEIIKDDTTTPLFERALYEGTYDLTLGLIIDRIDLVQGYDDTVLVTFSGVHEEFFQLNRDGPSSTLTVSESLPAEIFSEQSLTLIVTASKPRTIGATAIVHISLPQVITIQFERNYYEGTIIEDHLSISDLILIQGYEGHTVSVEVSNDYFNATIQENRITLIKSELPESVIEENSFLNLEVTASTEHSSATAIVTLEIIKDDTTTPLFERALYEGTYDPTLGLTVDRIILVQGYDDTVSVTLSGVHEDFFQLNRDGPSSTLTVSESLPVEIFSEQSLTLTVTATKPRTIGATAIVHVWLPQARLMTFEAPTYSGTYQNGILTHNPIILNVGFEDNVNFTINGDHERYFQLANTGNEVTITLLEQLPENVVLENNILMLIVSASGVNAQTATTTVLIDIIKEDATTPVFSENIYHVIYNSDETIEIKENIRLRQGYDSTVTFSLDGEGSQYFGYNQQENGVEIYLRNPIPESIIFEEKALVFNLVANKPLTVGANAAILVTFPTELTNPAEMRFSQNTYVGYLEEDHLTLEDIILSSGYTDGTEFILTGDHYTYFTKSNVNGIVSIDISTTLPTDIVEENQFIILELEARRERAVPVFCTVIIELVKHEDVVVFPVFNEAYYRGNYDNDTGLQLNEEIYLTQGYTVSVVFRLDGDYSNLFTVTESNNFITISANDIPDNVLESNDQIFLTIVAQTPHTIDSRAAVVIDLPKELTSETVLAFEHINYVGSVETETDAINLPQITLIQGYSEEVTFTIHGELENYFTLSENGATVTLVLRSRIPEESIPANQIIVLELSASVEASLPAIATLVLEIISDDDSSPNPDVLIFDETYYLGTYTITTGLVFDNSISLSEGYDENVQFYLEGADSVYFSLDRNENSVTLVINNPIPPEIVASNNQLLFVVTAQRPGSTTARATVVISLADEITSDTVLAFEHINYVGSLETETDAINLPQITLIQGYSEDVRFTIHGELENYFTLSENGATVTLVLRSRIPEESIPANQIIVLELSASVEASLPAIATLVLEVISDDDSSPNPDVLIFDETYYLGTYTITTGLVFDNSISLSEGYDENVQFYLEGADSVYFSLDRNENSVTLVINNPIPPEIVASNNQLLFVVTAQRPGSTTARATVVISLADEITSDTVLAFEHINYVGSLETETDAINLPQITLIQGYSEDVRFTIHGELENYFTLSENGATVTLVLRSRIPEESIPANQIIVLELSASVEASLPAIATLVLEVISDDDSSPNPDVLIFDETYYLGTYTITTGLVFDNSISLSEGYDENVQFYLEGADSVYFSLDRNENSVTLVINNPIPPEIVASNNQLLFVVTAQRPGSTTARATVVISLADEITSDTVLAFEHINYVGSLETETDAINLPQITLIQGYSEDVRFTIHGELENYFTLSENGATVTLVLRSRIPEESIPANQIIVLELSASVEASLPAIATLVLEVISDDDSSPNPDVLIFDETYYLGTYTITTGLVFDNSISLSEGYDENVQFYLEGTDSVYFSLDRNENSVTLVINNPIPPEIVASNNQLLFVVTAQRPGSTTARATVVISLADEITSDTVLSFEHINYVGSLETETDAINLPQITLIQGYSEDVTFTIHGELENYFTLSENGATVTLLLRSSIPEESIPANQIIVLELSASVEASLPAIATLVLEVISDDDSSPNPDVLIFDETYYLGTYTITTGLVFDNSISLSEGYDENVQFYLEGDDSVYFSLDRNENSVTLVINNTIPPEIVASNNQLLFVITAQRPGSTTARATVVISLADEITSDTVLAFEHINYVGSLETETDAINLPQITLIQGYSEDVTFTIHGELENYFTLSENGATVTLLLRSSIPEESIPANHIIVLELSASMEASLPAMATLVLEVISDDDSSPNPDVLTFAETYYLGTYTITTGLVFDNSISLSEGYDENVQFYLEGDDSVYFSLDRNENSVTLVINNTIPPEIVASNNQLLFVVTAQRPGSTTARATVVISLADEITSDTVLSFEHINYVGSLETETDAINLPQITLIQGYSEDVTFTIHGELENYFTLSENGATVTLVLRSRIPEESIPANQIIVLELSASVEASLPAIATLVLEVISDDDSSPNPDVLIFDETYYLGTYTITTGLVFDNSISLSEGYDENVQFYLEGDDSVYFSLDRNENSVTLVINNTIPPEIVASNNQQLFVITAQRPGSTTARATVVISLADEITSDTVLSFEHINYVGSLETETDAINLPQITLIQGYSEDVTFTIHGELENYFTLSENGATVTLVLRSRIPEESIPANQIIVLELSASVEASLPAIATLVLEVISDDDSSPNPDVLIFDETYYLGTYTITTGLVFDNSISLSEGYDENVQFYLEGDDSVYFSLDRNENSVTLVINNTIPPEIVASNNQLLFVITAQRPGSTTARATVVISLADEITSDTVLAFEHINYVGSLETETDAINLPQITLIQGYSEDVTFTIHGELENYFTLSENGATVTLLLRSSIPEESIPANHIIVLELSASMEASLPAMATLVLEVISDGDSSPNPDVLIFDETYYLGTYTITTGLVFDNSISLSEGYDENVQFYLEGADSVYFSLDRNENSVTLVINNTIPPEIVASNNQLLFVITAQRPGSTTARATVVISLADEITSDTVLAFEHINYVGSLETETDAINLPQITLIQGYSEDVTFTIHGELENYFTLSENGATVTLLLRSSIPEESIPANQIIVLELRASVEASLPAIATLVLEVISDDDSSPNPDVLTFAETYYLGTYTITTGLVFDNSISLSEGYDENVQFYLEGADSVYFSLDRNENSVTLVINNTIPPEIVASNNQLLFVVTAQRPGSTTARATVVISLADEITSDTVLSFEHINYVGSLETETDAINLPQITLIQGYSEDVTFTIHGELENYFTLSENGATVTLLLRSSIPEESIPANHIVVLELSASMEASLPAMATLVLEVISDDDSSPNPDVLTFAETYYLGTYTITTGLVFDNSISLSEGYDENVQFYLEGADSVYFSLDRNENSVTLVINNTIPPEIVASNNQLLFVITAQRPGSTTARATVVISLADEITSDTVLAFEHINYVGSLETETDAINLPQITLIQGYSEDVTFTIHGELENYFTLSENGATVTLLLRSSIPEESIPANQIIVLELRASVEASLPAIATLVLEVISDDDSSPNPDVLTFAETYYLGTYTITTGLVFDNSISLSEGYDENVQFYLEGADSVYFSLDRNENSVTLVINNTIPPEIVASNNQLLFVVTAQRPGSTTARATVVISLADEITSDTVLSFEHINYVGSLETETDAINLPQITLIQGYSEDVTFTILGELENYFTLSENGATVTLALRSSIPEESIPANQIIVLELSASVEASLPAIATLVLEVISDDDSSPNPDVLTFAETYYLGTYTITTGLVFDNSISLSEGYDENVQFYLEGADSVYFSLDRNENSVTLVINNTIPPEIVASNNQLLFVITAQRPGSTTARATVVISLADEITSDTVLSFEHINYVGSLETETDAINLPQITLIQGYSEDVTFTIHGELENYFTLSENGATVTLALRSSIPEESIPANQIIVLELSASVEASLPAIATLVLEVISDDDSSPNPDVLTFAETYYLGTYTITTGLVFDNSISLSEGYDENVQFYLEGADSVYFSLDRNENSVTLVINNTIPPEIVASNNQLLFVVTAQRPGSTTARATVVISLADEITSDTVLAFEHINYVGSLETETDAINLPQIILIQGYSEDVTFTIHGELENYFTLSENGATVTLLLRSSIPEESIPANHIVVLELSASMEASLPAMATLVLEVISDDDSSPNPDVLTFAETYYLGTYTITTGLVFDNSISLSEGYDENVQFYLEGDDSVYFSLDRNENSVTLVINNTIPPEIVASNNQLLFVVTAQRPGSTTARATVVISFADESESHDVFFSKFVYEGLLQGIEVHHETIIVSGFYGTNIEILGEYSSLFVASLSEGMVVIQTMNSAVLPTNVAYIALQLRAGSAGSVLLLEVQEEIQTLPTVTFSSPSYVLRVEISQTGFIGSVHATADNDETLSYSLLSNNEHLQSRLTINNNGDLHLSSPAYSGVYTFQVIATTVFTQVTGTASAYLTVESATVCGGDIVIPPLLILDRDEEEEHRDLVVLNDTEFPGCQYRLTNRWPVDQDWLYVDESGLHARAIDREHESIAFMALSQVQVELILECDSDTTRFKRSLDTSTSSKSLGPYDYGNSNWILTDTILYNSRRSFVNLIVNDINDNSPIFIGKENEPIVVGHPVSELEEIILTRYLVKLEATDADIGENAALMYSTNAQEVVVSGSTGIVYAAGPLSDQSTVTINATDQRGQGLTGTIQLLVRLLDVDNIAILTVHDMFLEDEQTVVDQLNSALGYEVKVLRALVVTNEVVDEESSDEEAMRKKRETTDTGISLQLYVYGLVQRELITADRLTEDITNSEVTAVSVTSAMRLEDYLEGRDTCAGPGRDVGLLVATIVLSVILFLIIVAGAVWFFLKWRKNRNYDQFSDQGSLRSDSSNPSVKLENFPTPRINIEELKKSEKRLQEMLDGPYIEQPEERVDEIAPNYDNPKETVIDMPLPEPISTIVIEDKLNDVDANHSDEDEFGEIKPQRKKSIVTFNENVQKIIHVDDGLDNDSHSDIEIYNF